jgi:diphosphomevalonate decarboxylase
VVSDNGFPTGAGLASSASGFAALALAASRAAGLTLDRTTLSILARQGSGSAARSVYGGFVELHAGIADNGRDALAEPLADEDWPLSVLVAITSERPKPVSSAVGMRRTVQTSPFYGGWVKAAPADLDAVRAAVRERDLERLGELAEHSCLKMHGLMLSTRPPLIYWTPATLAVIEAVRALRAAGQPAWFTVDAGPQVKVLCEPGAAARVQRALEVIDGVQRVIATGPGSGALIERTT